MQERSDLNWVGARLARWRQSGEAEALGELLRWQRDRAFAIALRILGRPDVAEDAVQQGFVKLMSRTRGFEDVEAFRVTVYRAVVQCALDIARADRARGEREKAMSSSESSRPGGSPSTSPLQAVEQAEAAEFVREELTSLPEAECTAVVLCCQEGMSVAAAAEVLEVNRETLRDRLARSLTGMRGRLRRRGLTLSLVAVTALLQKGSAVAAPVSLQQALDASLPGLPCTQVTAAAALEVSPITVLATAGLSTGLVSVKLLAAGFILAAGVGVAATFAASGNKTDAIGRTGPKPVAPVPRAAKTAAPAAGAQPVLRAAISLDTKGGADRPTREEQTMKKRTAAMVMGAILTGGALLAPKPALADPTTAEPAKVARIIAQIREYRAQKAKSTPNRDASGRYISQPPGNQNGTITTQDRNVIRR